MSEFQDESQNNNAFCRSSEATGNDVSRIVQVFDLAYGCLRAKINNGRILVDNEASLQLHFAAILKSVGELHEFAPNERFTIELEKAVSLQAESIKSRSRRAKIDIVIGYTNASTQKPVSCAIELKFFKRENHREPNNRYDVFADIHNLENYGQHAQQCFLVVATDHMHYVTKDVYSPETGDFNFSDGHTYRAGTELSYRTSTPYGGPITLRHNYEFHWDKFIKGLHFLRLAVAPDRNAAG